jgi:hypothetical protein
MQTDTDDQIADVAYSLNEIRQSSSNLEEQVKEMQRSLDQVTYALDAIQKGYDKRWPSWGSRLVIELALVTLLIVNLKQLGWWPFHY